MDAGVAGLGVRKWVESGRGLKVGWELGTFGNFVFLGPEVVVDAGVLRRGGGVNVKVGKV